MRSVFPVICSQAIAASRDFYASLFGMKPVFEIDWYVQLRSEADPAVQLGFVRRDHDSVPAAFQRPAAGIFVTVEVGDAGAVHARARELGLDIVYALRDEVWGQRHFMVVDPNGLPVDVVQIIPPSPDFLRAHGLA